MTKTKENRLARESYPYKASIREVIKLGWDTDLWLARGEKEHALAVIFLIRAELDNIEKGLRS